MSNELEPLGSKLLLSGIFQNIAKAINSAENRYIRYKVRY